MKTNFTLTMLLFAAAGAVLLAVPKVSVADDNAPQATVQINEPAGAQNLFLSSSGKFARSSDLIGTPVLDAQKEQLGQIKEVIFDWQTGHVPFAVISSESGDKLVAIPPELFQPQAGQKILVLNVDKEKFLSAPSFTASTWPNLSSPAWANQVYGYYSQPVYWQAMVPAGDVAIQEPAGMPSRFVTGREQDEQANHILHLYQQGKGAAARTDREINAKTGEELYAQFPASDQAMVVGMAVETPMPAAAFSESAGAQPAAALKLTRSSELIGLQVKDSSGNTIGEIKDVVIDWPSSRIAYAVLVPTGISGLENKYLAIPPTALKRSATDSKTLMLNVDKTRLTAAPNFETTTWPDPANQTFLIEIYHYYGQTPYWGGAAPAPAPAVREPSGAESELYGHPRGNHDHEKGAEHLRDQSRREMREPSGAGMEGSTIILRGTVNSEKESQDLAAKAAALPGVKQIINRLHVKSGAAEVKEPSGAEPNDNAQPSTIEKVAPEEKPPTPSVTQPQTPQPEATPETQTLNTDRALSQKVRAGFQADAVLSPLMQNIHITTANGKVTLRGTVSSEAEKQLLETKAEEIAGAGNVTNELEVKAPGN